MAIDIAEFLIELDEWNVHFCSWKNNHLLGEVLACQKDLDIYVPLRQRALFLKILGKYNFVEGASNLSSYPFIAHYYALGEPGKLFHLHVYYRLMTGESQLKDFWLPLERILEHRRVKHEDIFYVPDAELQRLIFVLRHYLKKSTLMGLLMHWREREDYSDEYDSLVCDGLGGDIAAQIDKDLILSLDRSLNSAGVFQTWWLGMKLRVTLGGLRSLSVPQAFVQRYALIAKRIFNKLLSLSGKQLLCGGRFIAITGLDGVGKTSLIDSVTSVLGRDFSVQQVHLGRPPATVLTMPVRLLIWARRRFYPGMAEQGRDEVGRAKQGTVAALRYAVLAFERKRMAKRAFRSACRGNIVISDRYPSITIGKMDSPQISSAGTSALVRWLACFEQNCYHTLPPPDLLLELYVDIEVAVERNRKRIKDGKETEEELRVRYQSNSNLEYRVLRHIRMDNDQSFEEAKSRVMQVIWTALG